MDSNPEPVMAERKFTIKLKMPSSVDQGEQKSKGKNEKEITCPICSARVGPESYEAHCELEINRLKNNKALSAGRREQMMHGEKEKGGASASLNGGSGNISSGGGKREAFLHARRKVASTDAGDVGGEFSNNNQLNSGPPSSTEGGEGAEYFARRDEGMDVLKRVRKNRAARLKAAGGGYYEDKRRGRGAAAVAVKPEVADELAQQQPMCPICGDMLFGDDEAVNMHVDNCLNDAAASNNTNATTSSTAASSKGKSVSRRGAGGRKSDKAQQQQQRIVSNFGGEVGGEQMGVEEEFETYTWAGQTRVRATTMLEGGYAASGFATTSRAKREAEEKRERERKKSKRDVNADEEEELLDIDGDEEAQFGDSQYAEADVIPCEEDETRHQISELLGSAQNRSSLADGDVDNTQVEAEAPTGALAAEDDGLGPGKNSSIIINSLKAMVKSLQQQIAGRAENTGKCLVCLEEYQTPVVSTKCWHVHCEQCWLRTLGAKKLCPQCNIITSTADLRRIYL